MFEVQDLRFATLATVSRCGMVWFSEDVLSTEMIYENFLLRLKHLPVEDGDDDPLFRHGKPQDGGEEEVSPTLQVGVILPTHFTNDFKLVIS